MLKFSKTHWTNLVLQDKADLFILGTYTIIQSFLALAVPLAAQAVVNTIASGVLLQPLIVLSFLTFIGLLLSGWLKLLESHLVEKLQERVFVRVALFITCKLKVSQYLPFTQNYAPEYANRFFDVLTIQKTWSKLLLDVPTITLQIILGLFILTIYHPLMIGFGLIVLAIFWFILFPLGHNGIDTSIEESNQKYRLAEWLQDIARCIASLKLHTDAHFLAKQSDDILQNYLIARRTHYWVFFRQLAGNYLFQAFASAGILAIGGWLVIQRQLTLGQLVASEIIVLGLLAAFDKLVGLTESFYDLGTSMIKINQVLELPEETYNSKIPIDSKTTGPASIECSRIYYKFWEHATNYQLEDVSLTIAKGQHTAIVGDSGSGKSLLLQVMSALLEKQNGSLWLDNHEIELWGLENWRKRVSLVTDNEAIFKGTILENILLDRQEDSTLLTPYADFSLDTILDICQLKEDIQNLPDALNTKLVSQGLNISKGQRQAILLARSIVKMPNILMLDEPFTAIDERKKLTILSKLLSDQAPWTVIISSQDPVVIQQTQQIIILKQGQVIESGATSELIRSQNSYLRYLFPASLTNNYDYHRIR